MRIRLETNRILKIKSHWLEYESNPYNQMLPVAIPETQNISQPTSKYRARPSPFFGAPDFIGASKRYFLACNHAITERARRGTCQWHDSQTERAKDQEKRDWGSLEGREEGRSTVCLNPAQSKDTQATGRPKAGKTRWKTHIMDRRRYWPEEQLVIMVLASNNDLLGSTWSLPKTTSVTWIPPGAS